MVSESNWWQVSGVQTRITRTPRLDKCQQAVLHICGYTRTRWLRRKGQFLRGEIVFGLSLTPQWATASSFKRFLDHTQRRPTFGRTPGRVISSTLKPLPDSTQHSQQTDIHAPGGIRTHNLGRRTAADLPVRPRGRWDRVLVGKHGGSYGATS
jgi:hypothetical protein